MNRRIYILLLVIGIIGFYSVAFAEDCNLTVKCVCESNSLRVVPCPDFVNEAIDCTKEGIPEGTCAVDCGQEVAASCDEIGVECRNNETANCLVTLPVMAGTSTGGCPSGLTECSGQCVDLSSNEANCGACDNPCTTEETCVSGGCEPTVCAPGETDCSGQCIDLSNDNAHCGACGNACQPEETCVSGLCEPSVCGSDADCAAGQYCGQIDIPPFTFQCLNKKGNGAVCLQQNECASGNCVDGYCCDSACGGECDSCNISGNEGTCTSNADGSPGSPSCSPYLCNGVFVTCPDSCTSDADCVSTHHCVGGLCEAR